MKMDLASLFLLIVVACVGVALGALLQGLLDRRSSSRRQLPTEPPLPQPPSSPAVPGQEKPVSMRPGEILAAGRLPSGEVWLEMDGVRLRAEDALQPERRSKLINLLKELRPWIDGTPAPAVPGADLPGLAAVSSILGIKGKPAVVADKPVVAAKSFLEQIDEILQAKLDATSYKSRGISLREGPGGVVLVFDGLKKYEGIDAVPDPEVKALIRQAVAEWENSTR